MASTAKERDLGWNKLKKSLAKMGGVEVVVGIPGAINFSEPNTAAIGAVHEFGSADGTIKERSFLRSTFDQNEKKYQTLLSKSVAESVKAKKSEVAGLFRLGETVRADVINRIRKREIVQELADATTKAFIAPGSSTRRGDQPALINTGNLVGSITSELRRVT